MPPFFIMSNKLLTVFNGATAAFTPASISGLVAWYDFSDAATLFTDSARTTAVTADGDAIGGVTDKSTSANHLSNTGGTTRPLYKTTIQNSKSVGRADGVNDYLKKASPSFSNKPITLFLVYARKNTTSNRYVIGMGTGSPAVLQNYVANTVEYFGNTPRASMGTATTDTFALHEFVLTSGGAVTTYKNGTQVATGSGAPSAVTMLTLFADDAVGINPSNCDIAECLIYNVALSDANRQAVESYLNTKWSLY